MENISELKSLFSEFENQINNFILLHESQRTYPEQNRWIIEQNISFYEIDKNISQFLSNDALTYINELHDKLKLISENEEVIDSITNYIFNFIDLWGDHRKVKENLINVLAKYSDKINNYINKFPKESLPTVKSQSKKLKKKIGVFDKAFYSEIVGFSYMGEALFSEDLSFKEIEKQLRFFTSKKFDKITTPLNFNAKYDYIAYYILTKIADVSNINYNSIMNVTINGLPYCQKKRALAFTKQINPKIISLDSDFNDFMHQVDSILLKYTPAN